MKRADSPEYVHINKCVIGLSQIMNKQHIWINKFIILDERARSLRIYASAQDELEEEHDLRFTVVLLLHQG